MLLTLDRGNTTLDVMLHGPVPRRARLEPREPLVAFLGRDRPSAAVAVTVVPNALATALAELQQLGVPVAQIGIDLRCPLPLDYDTPETLGADRWLSALAAHRRWGRAVVVDCGSATTVNLIEDDGTFRGGAIAPGLRALSHGMSVITPHLQEADVRSASDVPPRSSATAVHTGLLLSYCGAIERMVADTVAVARGPCTVVITGGHAEDYLRRGRLRPVVAPDLVHQGLHLCAVESGWSC